MKLRLTKTINYHTKPNLYCEYDTEKENKECWEDKLRLVRGFAKEDLVDQVLGLKWSLKVMGERAGLLCQMLNEMIISDRLETSYNTGIKDGLSSAKELLEMVFEMEKEGAKCLQ